MAKESNIQNSILRYLNKLPNSRWYNLHGSGWVGSGRPDIVGCLNGRFVAIEVKKPGEVPTKIQQFELMEFRDAGAIAFVATSADEVRQILQDEDDGAN
jgi:Holliday junction resolvase